MSDPTLTDMIACVERELRLRDRAYPRWVAAQRMTQAKADAEIRIMRAVLAKLQSLVTPEAPAQGGLFS